MTINIDRILSYTIALGIPKLIFALLKITSSQEGKAVVISGLEQISLNIGIEQGIGVFVLIGLISYRLSEHYIEKCFANKIERERLEKKLLTKDILMKLDAYQISKSLCQKLKTTYILSNYY